MNSVLEAGRDIWLAHNHNHADQEPNNIIAVTIGLIYAMGKNLTVVRNFLRDTVSSDIFNCYCGGLRESFVPITVGLNIYSRPFHSHICISDINRKLIIQLKK